ncbi:MAG: MgtC/SapB family protein [Erysipelotrichaceae bacterium]|nr:MgtC/SapB family protein [Erysipelotrichaceae bacterium]
MEMFEMEWLYRISAVIAAGVLIGYERRNRAKEAGIRTHSMVALGSCLLMLISKYGFRDIGTGDPARVAAQVVSGIGFLGAGVIFVRHDVVQGLTTAAGIWATSALGLCFGAGMYVMGVVATVLMVVVQHLFRLFLPRSSINVVLEMKVYMTEDGGINDVVEVLHKQHFHQTGENRFTSDGRGGWVLICEVATSSGGRPEELLKELNRKDCIVSAEIM